MRIRLILGSAVGLAGLAVLALSATATQDALKSVAGPGSTRPGHTVPASDASGTLAAQPATRTQAQPESTSQQAAGGVGAAQAPDRQPAGMTAAQPVTAGPSIYEQQLRAKIPGPTPPISRSAGPGPKPHY